MPRFFFHIHEAGAVAPDEHGRELRDLDAARQEALKGARSILSADVMTGLVDLGGRIEVFDEQGEAVAVVPFSAAVAFRNGPGGRG